MQWLEKDTDAQGRRKRFAHLTETERCQMMWGQVILQAQEDARSNIQTASMVREVALEKARARAWLSGGSRDFRTVCSLAGLEPQYMTGKLRDWVAALELKEQLVGAGVKQQLAYDEKGQMYVKDWF